MPICSSGVSAPKPGVATSIVVDQAYIQSILPPALAWLYPYLPFMHGLQIGDVPTFCSVDPPTWTVPSGGDIYAFVTGGPIGQVQTVTQFLQDITRAYLWYGLCECSSVATPAPPSAPAAPSDLPAVNPPGIVGSQPGACASTTGEARVLTTDGQRDLIHNVNYGYVGGPAVSSLYTPIPTGAQRAHLTFTRVRYVTAPSGGFSMTTGYMSVFDGATFITDVGPATMVIGTNPGNPPSVWTADYSVPSSATDFILHANCGDPTESCVYNVSVDWYCDSGTIPSGGQSCCTATDPITTGMLSQILQLLTLIQRQAAPFAYVPGPVHSGLTGTGSITVQGILGLHASCTTAASTRLIVGTPDVHLELGRLNLGTSDAFVDRVALVVGEQLVVPAAAGIYTIVGYTLEPGVTLTLTELIREP